MSIRMQAARSGMASWMVTVIVVIVLALIFIALGAAIARHPECPHTTELGTISIAGPITNVPEFHDCQRLVIAGQYGPLVAVWVSNRINQLYADLGPVPQDTVGRPADSADLLAATNTTSRSVPVLQIYNYGDPVPFAPLGELPFGFTCVYFTLVQDSTLRAWKYSTGTNNDCYQPLTRSEFVPVTRVSFEFTKDTDYPPVARWEWDAGQARHGVGVKCGTAWCRLGPLRMTVQHYDNLVTAAGEDSRVFSIPGWYDEQVLSAPEGGLIPIKFIRREGLFPFRIILFGRNLKPSGVRGTIFPDPSLESRRIGDFEKWVRVAEVHLSEPSEHYARKFNFVHHTEQPAAVIHLRHSTEHDPWPVLKSRDDDWQAAIVSSAGDTIFRKVIWRGYHDSKAQPGWVPTPGTVRWRWLEVDETTWEWCPEGCCETTTESP
ncbi:MAG: hypothetical protein KFH98_15125 [Gemmatimonadetes bacterium]|nr:hypothetical protein [Gemmatimonadota bacterium]